MRFLPLTACALLFALPAKADKFWLSDPDAQKNGAAASSPDVIEGVLLAEDADSYHIRVVGGEVVLAKKRVFKVEKDGLTIDAIVKAEKDSAEALALANKERELHQEIARKEREIRAVEAAARKGAAQPAAAPQPEVTAPAEFDPVLGVATGAMGRAGLLREAKLAYERTGDRAWLRALRQLRRLN